MTKLSAKLKSGCWLKGRVEGYNVSVGGRAEEEGVVCVKQREDCAKNFFSFYCEDVCYV